MAIVLQLRNVADYDAPKTGWSSDFTIVKDGDGIKISHDCKQSYDSSYEEFETIAKSVTFTKSTKPSTGTDAFAGTWVKGSDTVVFDGKGNGTAGSFSFTYKVGSDGKATYSYGYRDWTAELSSDGNSFTVSYYDDDAMIDVKNTFTKQA